MKAKSTIFSKNLLECRAGFEYNMKVSFMSSPIKIIDTTLRDGLQSPLWDDFGKYYPSTSDKCEVVKALAKYGVDYIEIFSPSVSRREADDLKAILETRDEISRELGKPIHILTHVRCHPRDIEEALKYKIDGLNFYMGTSEISRKSNHGKTLREIVKMVRPLLSDIKKNYPHLLMRFSGEDAFRTKIADLFFVFDSVADIVDRLGIPDTVGVATPREVAARIKLIKKRYPNVPLEGHFHNDRGLSLINALTAVESGMEYLNTAVLGLAERSGITSLTSFIFNLYLINPKLVKDYDISLSYPLNVLVADILDAHVPATEPVSLSNRTHSAGVHTQAVKKDASVYEAHSLARFGVTEQRLLLGPLSGKHIIHYYLSEVLNYSGITEQIAENITTIFKDRSEEITKNKTPKILLDEIATGARLPRIDKPTVHLENI